MSNELENCIFTEKYRPQSFEDLVFDKKELILKYLKDPKATPSFIFHSNRPGTGKTSLAKLIIKYLDCDSLVINASDERGIDTIREKVKLFARSLSSDVTKKRCVFMDEADGVTKIGLDSLRNLMEEYSANCFFILSCNNLSKIIEPIQSRCVIINFEQPNKDLIKERLSVIVEKEKLEISDKLIDQVVNAQYPDIRSMISWIQTYSLGEASVESVEEFRELIKAIVKNDIDYVYKKTYSGTLRIVEFVKFFFDYLFKNYAKIGMDSTREISYHLAEVEKSIYVGCNSEISFLSNMLAIMKIFQDRKK